MGTSAFVQLKLLLRRNVLIKRRNRRQTTVEIIFPLIYFFILIVLKSNIPNTIVPARPNSNTLTLLNDDEQNQQGTTSTSPKSFTLIHFLEGTGQLLYAPNTSLDVQRLVSSLNGSLSPELSSRIIGFPDSDSIDVRYQLASNQSNPAETVWAAVEFVTDADTNNLDPTSIQYAIRINGSDVTDIDVSPLSMDAISLQSSEYISSGFLTLQTVVNEAVLNFQQDSNDASAILNISVQDYPVRTSRNDVFHSVILATGALFFVIGFIPIASRSINLIVAEKELKTRQGMMMMGLRGWIFYLCWYITYFVIVLIPAAIIGVLAGVLGLFDFTSPFFLFLIVLLYAQSLIAVAFVVSAFFDKARLAAQLGSIGVIILAVPQYALTSTTPATAIIAACLSSPVALAIGFNAIFDAELDSGGISLSNLKGGTNTVVGYDTAVVMLVIDTVLYMFLAWYLDNVLPSEFGQSKHPLFCFKRIGKLFCGSKRDVGSVHLMKDRSLDEDGLNVEAVETDVLAKGKVVIRDLVKVFTSRFWSFGGSDKSVRAVDGLNLTCYQDQILALLGHNGAGKSTTIGVMTGMLEPTDGSIEINGSDLIENMDSVREDMGVCLQDDILFEKLTVAEHLRFYGRLKGISANLVDFDLNKMIDLLGLQEKRNTYASTLSGGQKRKLSVAIALIGDPQIIFLDEPTSGMDPYSRRRVWEVLEEYKKGRFILLTTHFMDEADLLGDRIAIMSHGSLRCVGSSLFLKNRFGIGYHLVLSTEQKCDHERVSSTVKEFLPSAKLDSDVGTEMEFLVPTEQVSNFVDFFQLLESKDNDTGITDFGVSLTTLEEVFLRIADEEGSNEDDEDYMDVDFVTTKSEASWTLVMGKKSTDMDVIGEKHTAHLDTSKQIGEGKTREENGDKEQREAFIKVSDIEHVDVGILAPFWWTQMKAMLKKRFLMARRDFRSVLMQAIFPAVYVAILLAIVPKDRGTFLFSPDSLPISDPTVAQTSLQGAPINIFGSDETVLNTTASIFSPLFDVKTTISQDPLGDMVSFLLNGTIAGPPLDPSDLPETYAAIVANSIDLDSNQVDMTILTNSSRPHAFPIMLDIISNSLSSISNTAIQTTNEPFPFQATDSGGEDTASIIIPIFLALVLSYAPIGFGMLLLKERISKAKHLQFVMGTPPWIYWLSNFISDMIGYSIVIFLIFIFFAIFNESSILGSNAVAALVLFFVCAMALTWLVYCFTFLVDKTEQFASLCTFLIIFGGIALFFVLFSLEVTNNAAVPYLAALFSFLPTLSLAYGLRQLVILDGSAFETDSADALAWDVTGRHIIITGTFCIIYTCIVLMADMGTFRRIFGRPKNVPPPDSISEDEDTDVHIERQNVKDTLLKKLDKNKDLVTISELYKAYKTKDNDNEAAYVKAVNRLSLNIQNGECFGLLGPNGAGKTSTIDVLTCDLQADGGDAYMGGYDVSTEREKVFYILGFCPQFDGLHDLLTGKEHLEMYAKIKGVQEEFIPDLVRASLRNMDLMEYAKRISSKYSGGNKRKLNTAIALLADPKVVLLDEPSTGMDPVTRRKLWDFISENIQDRAIILTTHSMEEADALCTRIGIMVNGTLRCVGTSQHLKSVHGSGYQLELRTNIDEEKQLHSVKEFIESLVESPSLLEEFGGRLRYNIPQSKLSLAQLFSQMENTKGKLGIQDYSISQTTLEQVFIGFAKGQENPE